MKTKPLLLALFLLLNTNIFCQQIGFHFGFTSSNMLDRDEFSKPDENYENVFGLDIGVDLRINFKDNLALLTGLSYYQNGFQADAIRIGDAERLEKNVKINYLKLPVSVVLKTRGEIGFAARSGAYISQILGGKFEVVGRPTDFFDGIFVEKAYKSFDYGFTFGGIVNIKDFSIDIGYDLGIKNISTSAEASISNNSKNRSWNIKFIYFFKSKKNALVNKN